MVDNETGVSFGSIHSYDDLDLVLTDAEIGTPEVQSSTLQIVGRNGVLDLTEASGMPLRYNNRTITLTFKTTTKKADATWAELITSISESLHGQKVEIKFDDDADYYYVGRCRLNKFETNRRMSTITIECDCEPFKYSHARYTEVITSGETTKGVLKEHHGRDLEAYDVTSLEPLEYLTDAVSTIDGGSMPTQPTIISDTAMTISIGGKAYTLKVGANIFDDLYLGTGKVEITFAQGASGTITIEFEKGEL